MLVTFIRNYLTFTNFVNDLFRYTDSHYLSQGSSRADWAGVKQSSDFSFLSVWIIGMCYHIQIVRGNLPKYLYM